MNITQPWNAFFFASFLVYLGIRRSYVKKTRHEEKSHRQVDALEKFLLTFVISGSLLLPMLYLFTPWLSFADYHLPTVARWCGAAAMLAALWLFWRSHADLGQNWSVTLELRKNHQLVTQGVYRSIRHPMYLSIWLFSLAQALLLPNWLAGWSAIVPFAILYFVRTPREEKMMREFFGQQYDDYMKNTGRLLPVIRRRQGSS